MSEVNEHVNVEVDVPAELFGGIWSNMVVVSHSQYEFTIDFTRIHFAEGPNENNVRRAVLVQRVNVSPLLVTQLIKALTDNMRKYEKIFGEQVTLAVMQGDTDDEEEPDASGGD